MLIQRRQDCRHGALATVMVTGRGASWHRLVGHIAVSNTGGIYLAHDDPEYIGGRPLDAGILEPRRYAWCLYTDQGTSVGDWESLQTLEDGDEMVFLPPAAMTWDDLKFSKDKIGDKTVAEVKTLRDNAADGAGQALMRGDRESYVKLSDHAARLDGQLLKHRELFDG